MGVHPALAPGWVNDSKLGAPGPALPILGLHCHFCPVSLWFPGGCGQAQSSLMNKSYGKSPARWGMPAAVSQQVSLVAQPGLVSQSGWWVVPTSGFSCVTSGFSQPHLNGVIEIPVSPGVGVTCLRTRPQGRQEWQSLGWGWVPRASAQ